MEKSMKYANCRPAFPKQNVLFFTALFLLFSIQPSSDAEASSSISDSMPATIPAEIIADWEAQDSIKDGSYAAAIEKIKAEIPDADKVPAGDTKDAYIAACHWRRVYRLSWYWDQGDLKKILFAKHYNLGGPTPGYLEDLEPYGVVSGVGKLGAQGAVSRGTNFQKGGALCCLEMTDYYSRHTEILSDSIGVIRDPCASFDGTRVVFAWSKDNNGYHLHEMDLATKAVRALTEDPEGLTVSDYEPCYLQDSNIVFNSSRCFGLNSVTGLNITSNLFIIDKDGKYLRRVTYDQFSTFSPTLREDGRVLYTRWEGNDRNPYSAFPLMTMNPDASYQTEYFGNQSPWPVTIYHARQIPGVSKILAVVGSYTSSYAGELAVIDPDVGRNGVRSVSLVAPERDPVDTSNYLNGEKALFQNPWPLDEEYFIVSWRPSAEPSTAKYNIYLMNFRGERELLAWDSTQSVSQPLSLKPRSRPVTPKYQTNYKRTDSEVLLYNSYYISKGCGIDSTIDSTTLPIKKIRIIGIEYRTDPAFGSTGDPELCVTPVSRWLGAREVKRIIGEMPIEYDGSAAFLAPARTPFYVQLIDSSGFVINSQRSWTTLQPGERFSCYSCHENKNETTVQGKLPIALTPKPLEPFYGITGNFSFVRHIQPILDEKCISCHNETHEKGLDLRGNLKGTWDLTDPLNKDAGSAWSISYINLTDPAKKYVDYIDAKSPVTRVGPYSYGSSKSALVARLRGGHSELTFAPGQLETICAWIDLGIPYSGSYAEDMGTEAAALYLQQLQRRVKHEQLELQNISAFPGYPMSIYKDRYGSRKSGLNAASAHSITARFSRIDRRLSIRLPSEGTVTLLDLKGRKVWSISVNRRAFIENATVSRTVSFPPGLYIVNFSGIRGASRELVSLF